MPDLAYREVYAMNRLEARKRLIQTYQQTGSVRGTARRWHTLPQVVRRWLRCFQAQGQAGLKDRSRRPHCCPSQTPAEIEGQVIQARQATGYGPRRLARYLADTQGLRLSPHTIRHILRRAGLTRRYQRRRSLYPACWAWAASGPFALLQTDVKDILDKKALGTARWHHLRRHHLPRYQWTVCETHTRLRFLAWSHRLSRSHGLAFLLLVGLWLRAHGVQDPLAFQTDWGQEFGGDNPDRLADLQQRFLAPLDARLVRYPPGRKEYNGRVERSHRADDEEFYRPYLTTVTDTQAFLRLAARWVYFYNLVRPPLGAGMNERTPLQALRDSDYQGPDTDTIALFPPLLLDPFAHDLILACDPEVGNDLLAQ